MVFLVGFVVAVVIPAVKEAELSVAIASARTAISHFENQNPGLFITSLNYSFTDNTVHLDPQVYVRATGVRQRMPAELGQGMLLAIQSSVARQVNRTCATAANYNYCIN